jgi:Fe-S-cluster containining protein
MALFEAGVLSCGNAVTVREGERLRSHGDGRIYESFMELVKIRCREQSSVCFFYDNDKGCVIYENRPSQCRQYECWRRVDLYEGLEKNALGRKEIFNGTDALLEVIGSHEEKCSYKRLGIAFERAAAGDENAVEEIIDMLQYDTFVRPFLQEKFNVPADALDLLLGRPLTDAVNEFGFKVVREGDDYILMHVEDKAENKDEQ